MLQCYEKLIQSQLEMNCTEDVMKTFRAIKTFKLDSMNPQDVADYMENSLTESLELDAFSGAFVSNERTSFV